MKLMTFRLKNRDALPQCISTFQAQCPENTTTVLVSIYSGWTDEEEVRTLLCQIRSVLPEAVIVGCTTSGEIMAGTMSLRTTVVTFMAFTSTQLQAQVIDFSNVSVNDGAAEVIATCRKQDDLAGIEVLFANNNANAYAFLAAMNDLPHDLPVFGGVAGCEENGSSYVFVNDTIIRNGAVVLCFLGRDIHIQVNASQGWNPLGPWFRITAMAAENVITELDNRPANYIYEKYLAISPEDFEQEILVFPLFLERNGQQMLRHPACTTQEGAIVLHGDCRIGERVRLAYGNPAKILDALRNIHKNILYFEPQAIMIFNCSSRRFFLLDAANHELKPFENIAPSSGLYTAGEVGRTNKGEVSILNMTLVSVSFREGETLQYSNAVVQPNPSRKPLTGAMKLLQHLAHFITVTSEELEAANRQLQQLATTDRLTDLYNRGEIESILQKELSSRRQGNRQICAIMLDVDNFKMVNDTYGHAIGDAVLRRVGAALKRNIRRGDAAGRWGGEEFLIILPNCSIDTAANVAERIRTDVAKDYTLPNGEHVTVSLGVADFSEKLSYMDFYRILDDALYQAKHQGKNKVCVAAMGCQH
ncbi:MAG: diguanylate cyclase [Desulfovibrio sp.]|nr:diguanylate cyclase [Desulfovibrio sp.]